MPERDLALIEQAARDAGAIARKYFGGRYKQWDKGKGQPVTEADLEIDRFLCETLTRARPDYGWLSEESKDDPARLKAEYTFVVDPIDGTVGFMKGKPQFTIAIAVVRDGTPITGVVFNPITEDCFSAAQGVGATLNGAPIHVSAQETIEGCKMLSSKSLLQHPAWNNPPNTPWPEMNIETRSSIAYRMALVAGGEFDAMLALSTKHDWDLAAADIILREAGGSVSDHLGRALRYNGTVPHQPSVVAAGPALHARLIEKLRQVRLP
ncbi:MAG TPA: 3'(2'),5'-bisphosphate nucleotidase CysQ [Rhizomicrobium sp.]|nr:3'(2'),5'-bisphosphate nucleotidase CysQ [Rhizomicrobium sp.]